MANQIVLKLRRELDEAIALIVHAREALSNELNNEFAQKKLFIDDKFVKKLRELTGAFNSLTESKIRLDKAEKAMEADMTAEDERAAVLQYLREIDVEDRDAIFAESKRKPGNSRPLTFGEAGLDE